MTQKASFLFSVAHFLYSSAPVATQRVGLPDTGLPSFLFGPPSFFLAYLVLLYIFFLPSRYIACNIFNRVDDGIILSLLLEPVSEDFLVLTFLEK